MKKIFLSIALLSFAFDAISQDAIVVGARNYYKAHLKNPGSYIEYGFSKKPWTKMDELKSEMEENSWIIEDSSSVKTLLDYREKFTIGLNLKILETEKKIQVLTPYSDSSKFLQDYRKLKETCLSNLNEKLKVEKTTLNSGYVIWGYNPGSKLEEAKEKGNVNEIIKYEKEVDEVKKKIENIDEYVKQTYDFRNLHFVQLKRNKDYLDTLNKTLALKSENLASFDSIASLDEKKNYYLSDRICSECSMYSYYLEKVREREKAIEGRNQVVKGITYLKANPTKNTVLYYYVVLDNSGTNSYGARVREKNIVKYDPKTRDYEIID